MVVEGKSDDMKLFIKFTTMCCKVRRAELNIIERLERLGIDLGVLDEVVDIISDEMDSILK